MTQEQTRPQAPPPEAVAGLSMDAARGLVRAYYRVFDPQPGAAWVLRSVLAPGWRNVSSAGSALTAEEFLAFVAEIRQAVPDLRWHVDELLLAGDRIIVRGEGRGTPAAPLFGVAPTGRSFAILSIDIHRVREGRISSSFHLQDWAGALGQLQGR